MTTHVAVGFSAGQRGSVSALMPTRLLSKYATPPVLYALPLFVEQVEAAEGIPEETTLT